MRLRWVLLPLVLVSGCSQGTTSQTATTVLETSTTVSETSTTVSETSTTTDPALSALLMEYKWKETSDWVVRLQEVLGISPDGKYGKATREAHIEMLRQRGLTISGVPDVPDVPPPYIPPRSLVKQETEQLSYSTNFGHYTCRTKYYYSDNTIKYGNLYFKKSPC